MNERKDIALKPRVVLTKIALIVLSFEHFHST